MMNCGFSTKNETILERVLLAPIPFYCLTKFTIPEKEAKTRGEDEDDTGTGKRQGTATK